MDMNLNKFQEIVENRRDWHAMVLNLRLQYGRPWRLSWQGSACNAGDLSSIPGLGRWRREWLPTPVPWPGQFHGLQPASLLCLWEFSRQQYWSGLPCPPPGDLPDPGVKLRSLKSPVLAGGSFTTTVTGKPLLDVWMVSIFPQSMACLFIL